MVEATPAELKLTADEDYQRNKTRMDSNISKEMTSQACRAAQPLLQQPIAHGDQEEVEVACQEATAEAQGRGRGYRRSASCT